MVRFGLLEQNFEFWNKAEGVQVPGLTAARLGHVVANMLPEVTKDGDRGAGMLSATGTRGSLTMPDSMASISEKSLTVQGNRVPSA